MVLTEQEVLSDAGGLVDELIVALDAEDLNYAEKSCAILESIRVFKAVEDILRTILKQRYPQEGETIH